MIKALLIRQVVKWVVPFVVELILKKIISNLDDDDDVKHTFEKPLKNDCDLTDAQIDAMELRQALGKF